MSDEPDSTADMTEESAEDQPADAGETTNPEGAAKTAEAAVGDDESRLGEYLLKGALVLLALLALVATLQFYITTQTAISRWIDHEYRPIFLAAFNLVVLLASGVGITLVLRRLTR